MRGKRLVALAMAGLLLAPSLRAEDTAAPDAQPADWPPYNLVYEVHAGGLHVFTINLEATLEADSYNVSLGLLTDGALAWLLDWTMVSAAQGRVAAAQMAPAWFRTESNWRGTTRWVELSYRQGDAPSVEAVPPPEEDNRPAVPEALRLETVDPLSAAIALIYAMTRSGRCDSALSVFDGRRLFEAQASDLGATEIPVSDLAPFGGDTRACELTIEPVTGFWRDQRYEARSQELTVYLRALTPGGPPLPLRIDAETRFGAVRVHLVDVSPRPGEG